MPIPLPSVVKPEFVVIVGFAEVCHTTPLEVTLFPQSVMISPPVVIVVAVIPVTGIVLITVKLVRPKSLIFQLFVAFVKIALAEVEAQEYLLLPPLKFTPDFTVCNAQPFKIAS